MEMTYSNWVWTPQWTYAHNEEPQFVYFRKSIQLDFDVTKAALDISADSRYKLFINGEFVHCGPRKGDAKVWYYDTLDIASYLKQGENVFAVEVLRYPQNHRKGNHGIWRTEMPGFYAAGDIIGNANQRIDISANDTWQCTINPNVRIISENPYFAPMQILENAQGNGDFNGWKNNGYDDYTWAGAQAYISFFVPGAVSPGNLLPRPIPLMKNTKHSFDSAYCVRKSDVGKEAYDAMLKQKASVFIAPNAHEIIEIDAGELTTGYLKLVIEGGHGAVIKILTSECYSYEPKEGHFMALPRKGDRTDCVNGTLRGFTDTYEAAGFGTKAQPEVYEPYWFRTFRYVQLDIETMDEPLILDGFDYIETGYPLEVKTELKMDDPVMAEIWDISLRTLKRCMHETYEDCPFYEQLQYAMDTRSQILYTYSVSGDDRLARQCIDDFHRSVRYDGLINCSYPCYGPNVIPGFSIYYILMIYDHMMYFADKELICRYMSTVEGILDFFRRNLNPQGLVGKIGGLNGKDAYWSFIDWTSQWDETSGVPRATLKGPITMESFLYAYGLQHAARMMEFIGRKEDGAIYRAQSEAVLNAINANCLGANGLYQDGPGIDEYSQHCQVFAVLTETVKGEDAQRLLLKVLPEDTDGAKCSVAMAFYLFRAVEKVGLYAMTDKLWEPWRDMVKNHLTTCVEDGVNGRSDCHAWGALILYELPAVILGARPNNPGFADFVAQPVESPVGKVTGRAITPEFILEV